jgi:hypothetical protein
LHWQRGVRLAIAVGAGALAIFHHDPEHTDEMLDRIGREARPCSPPKRLPPRA